MDWRALSPDDYFAIEQVTETWTKGRDDFDVTFWRRPLVEMTRAIRDSGFFIHGVVEPRPNESLHITTPTDCETLRTRPQFLFFKLAAKDF